MVVGYLDEAGEAVGVDVHGHNAFVELIADVFMVGVFGVDPENAFSLEEEKEVSPEKGSKFGGVAGRGRERTLRPP